MGYVRPFTPAWAMSAIRVIALKARFAGRIEIGFDSYVGPRCRIHVARGGLLRLRNVNVTWDVLVAVAPRAVIEAGPNGWLGPGSMVSAQQRIVLGEGSMIAEYVTIRDHDHIHDAQHLMSEWRYTGAPVIIGENVWVGSKATIVSGVTIGDHAFVAANAVVTRDVKPGERVGGVPARPLPRPGQVRV
jgi:acetyltransferase-like isoleucine patch superfamily enzyme